MKLADRVAAVTGAASGIGRALCPVLGREGARLILIDRDQYGLESLAEELTAAGICNTPATVDVTCRDELRQAIRSAASELGPVDLLVACAGITGVTLLDDLQVDQLEAIARSAQRNPALLDDDRTVLDHEIGGRVMDVMAAYPIAVRGLKRCSGTGQLRVGRFMHN